MTADEIKALSPAFANYLQQFNFCCDYSQTFDLLKVYCHGLLSDLPRQSAEPLALASGVAVRTLQEFLRDHKWSFTQVRDTLQHSLLEVVRSQPPAPLGTIGIVDETSVVKKGTKTPGVQRQWCGAVGKLENCIVTVHLAVSCGHFHTLLDSALFLPQEWADDRERCRQAGIPDHLGHRPKWQLALRQITRAQAVGYDFTWLCFDEGYGGKPGFLDGLEERGLSYCGEVPKSFACFTRPPTDQEPSHWAEDLCRHSPVFYRQDWQEVTVPQQTLGEQTWHVKAAEVWVRRGDGLGVARRWLLVACRPGGAEVKYFVSGGREAEVAVRLRAGLQRYHVEHNFRVSKQELGLGHYEGRSWLGLMRHHMLCLVTLGFAAGEAASRRGEKPGGDDGAGVPGAGGGVSVVVVEAARGDGGRGAGVHDPVPTKT